MALNKLKVIVVDDEQDIREILVNTINESVEMEVVGQADSVQSSFDLIADTPCDALFLDIKIKGGDAFQLLRALQRRSIPVPPVIINTGFAEFEYVQRAHNEFGDAVIMILKKPFWENWAEKESQIIKKLEQRINSAPTPKITGANIIIKQDNSTYFVSLENLFLLETDLTAKGRGIVILHTVNRQYSVNRSLKNFIRDLPSFFVRVSRYAVVNIRYTERIDHADQTLHLRGHSAYVGIGNAYKDNLLNKLHKGTL